MHCASEMPRDRLWCWLSRLRWRIRKLPLLATVAYMLPNVYHALVNMRGPQGLGSADTPRGHVALCLRFRDEARFLEEWIDYHIAAGVDHFFLYNNFSADGYQQVLRRYQERGRVTLIDWPYTPASPSAEHDCIGRARGRFEWVGFIDADEFVVVRDGRSIPKFLSDFAHVPAVALHWYYYGSDGHERRPRERVICAYTRRSTESNRHFKVLVRPEQVTRNRNSHNFYYRLARRAMREDGRRVQGSMADPPSASRAWINHYYCKSLDDYLEKASRDSTLDRSGIREPSRQVTRAKAVMATANDVVDTCAIDYYEYRRRSLAESDPGVL